MKFSALRKAVGLVFILIKCSLINLQNHYVKFLSLLDWVDIVLFILHENF